MMRLHDIGIYPVMVVIMLCFHSGVTSAQVQSSSSLNTGNCGAKCLYTLLNAESLSVVNYGEFLKQYPACGEVAISLDMLADTAAKCGLECELIQFDAGKELPKCRHLIAHVKPDHFVILSQNKRGLWYYVDPPGSPTVLSPNVRANLSGAAIAVGIENSSWFSRRWIFIAFPILVGIGFGIKRLLGSGRRSIVNAFCLFIIATFGGCSDHEVTNRLEEAVSKRFSFEQTVIDLGDVIRSKEPRQIELRLVVTHRNDVPKIVSSCGCATVSLGVFDPATSTRKIVVSVVPEMLEERHVQVVAMSSIDSQSAVAAISYRVVGQIAVQAERPVFERQSESGHYRAHYRVVEDVNQSLARIEVLFSPEQIGRGFDWQLYRLGDGQFEIEIIAPQDAGYEHGYLSFLGQDGTKLHPEVPIEWGELVAWDLSVENIRLSTNQPSSSFVLHSDIGLPPLKFVATPAKGVEITAKSIATNLLRVDVLLRIEDDTSPLSYNGALAIVFEGGREKLVPLAIQ